MKAALTLEIVGSVRDGQIYGTGTPYQYKILGLPRKHEIHIAQFSHQGWKILRTRNGVQDKQWSGAYTSAEAALAEVQQEFADHKD